MLTTQWIKRMKNFLVVKSIITSWSDYKLKAKWGTLWVVDLEWECAMKSMWMEIPFVFQCLVQLMNAFNKYGKKIFKTETTLSSVSDTDKMKHWIQVERKSKKHCIPMKNHDDC